MKTKKNIKIVLIALLLAGAVAGFGYGMTATAKNRRGAGRRNGGGFRRIAHGAG